MVDFAILADNLWLVPLFIALSSIVGIIILILVTAAAKKIVEGLTPHYDEEKEIKKGNQAVAEYSGRLIQSVIIGISIIIGAAIIAAGIPG
jgi:uncharacterized membrane protein YjfL (UPF0719 family)